MEEAPAEVIGYDEDPLCAWCHGPVVDGAPRLRFFALVYHLACWDERVAADTRPGNLASASWQQGPPAEGGRVRIIYPVMVVALSAVAIVVLALALTWLASLHRLRSLRERLLEAAERIFSTVPCSEGVAVMAAGLVVLPPRAEGVRESSK